LNDIDLWFGATVEDHIEPVVLPQPLRRPVLVRRESHLPDGHPALHLDEPDFDGGLRIFRVRATGNQVETAVIGLDAW